jgi:hypothetical protein
MWFPEAMKIPEYMTAIISRNASHKNSYSQLVKRTIARVQAPSAGETLTPTLSKEESVRPFNIS